MFPLLLFPTGRPPFPRWSPVLWLAALSVAAITILAMLNPVLDLQNEDYAMRNPIGVPWVGDVEKTRVGSVLFALWSIALAAAFVSLVIRFRRARGEERQQLKWFTYGGVLVVVLTLPPIPSQVANFISGLPIAVPPIAVGIAILKYRLYDIDVIINRTLVYGALRAILAAVYFGSVVVLREIFAPLLGGNNQIAIVASTLAITALFNPLRKRIQVIIDRRFYRRKYDAAQVLAAFSVTARDEVDLERLTNELLAVTEERLQRSHVSLWLR